MISSQLKTLIRLNLLFLNPQITDRLRKKGKKDKKLIRAIATQYIYSALLFIVVYGMTMLSVPFDRMPGYFTFYTALFGILALSQGVSTVYNIFFESRDLAGYLPLPFRQKDIFLSKMLVVSLSVVPFVLPLLLVFILTAWRSGVFPIVAILIAVLLFVGFLIVIFELCSLIVFGLTKLTLFKKHKKLMISLLLFLSTGIAIIGILLINGQNQMKSSDEVVDHGVFPLFLPLFEMMHAPWRLQGIIAWAGLVALIALLGGIIKWTIFPKLYEQLLDASPGISHEKRKQKEKQTVNRLLITYNLQLMKDPNLMMQVFMNSLIMPLIFIISLGISGRFSLANIGNQFFIVFLVAGMILAFLITNSTSFVAIFISLDKENFPYIVALPLSMKRHLRIKFFFGWLIQLGGLVIFSIIGTLMFQLPLILAFSFFLGSVGSSYLFSEYYFWRDFRLMELGWTNATQLFSRGSGTIGMMFVMFGGLIGGTLLIGATIAGVLLLSPLYTTLVVGSLFIVSLIVSEWHYQRQYWAKIL